MFSCQVSDLGRLVIITKTAHVQFGDYIVIAVVERSAFDVGRAKKLVPVAGSYPGGVGAKALFQKF